MKAKHFNQEIAHTPKVTPSRPTSSFICGYYSGLTMCRKEGFCLAVQYCLFLRAIPPDTNASLKVSTSQCSHIESWYATSFLPIVFLY